MHRYSFILTSNLQELLSSVLPPPFLSYAFFVYLNSSHCDVHAQCSSNFRLSGCWLFRSKGQQPTAFCIVWVCVCRNGSHTTPFICWLQSGLYRQSVTLQRERALTENNKLPELRASFIQKKQRGASMLLWEVSSVVICQCRKKLPVILLLIMTYNNYAQWNWTYNAL